MSKQMKYLNKFKELMSSIGAENQYDNVYGVEKGCLEYTKDDTLYIWSGLGLGDSYGFEVEITSEVHLVNLLTLLVEEFWDEN